MLPAIVAFRRGGDDDDDDGDGGGGGGGGRVPDNVAWERRRGPVRSTVPDDIPHGRRDPIDMRLSGRDVRSHDRLLDPRGGP